MIINLTQHLGTPEQGVQEPKNKKLVQELLTFESLPTEEEIFLRAKKLAEMAEGGDSAMVGGAIFFIPALCRELRKRGITPLAAFSQRIVEEVTLPDGTVRKVNYFKHRGFVEIP